jgi:histidinol-phosphate aminotransferase
VTALSQAAARAVLGHRDLLRAQAAAVLRERERLAAALARTGGIRVHPSDANFLLLRTERPAHEVAAQLLARRVVVRDFSRTPLLEGCLRVSVGTPEENDAFRSALTEVLGTGRPA